MSRYEVGSDSPTTGIVVLLAVAKLLANIKESKLIFKSGISNIMFAFLNGESFDYIGSSNMVYNMMNSSFPSNVILSDGKVQDTANKEEDQLDWPKIGLESLKFVIELDQLSFKEPGPQLYAHVDTEFDRNDLVTNLKDIARKHNVTFGNVTKKERGLPPASLQSILKKKRDVPGILISNFDEQYSNKYYHGPYDRFSTLNEYDPSKGENQKIVEDLSSGKYNNHATVYRL